MKKPKKISLLCHAVIVLSLSLTTLFILDIYNPLLGFMESTYSRVLLCALFVLSFALAVKTDLSLRRSVSDSEGPEAEPSRQGSGSPSP